MLKRVALAGFAILSLVFPALVRAADYTFSWALPTPQGNALGGADFQDATTGYAVGPRGTVLVTGDGGQTWTSRELFPDFAADLEDVLVVGPGELIAAGASPGIFRSTDAGVSWVPITNPSFARLIDVERITGSVLSVVGDDGQVLRSTDNGASWSLLPSPGVHDLHEQYWSDAANGYIVGFPIARRTTNGGQTWLPLTDWPIRQLQRGLLHRPEPRRHPERFQDLSQHERRGELGQRLREPGRLHGKRRGPQPVPLPRRHQRGRRRDLRDHERRRRLGGEAVRRRRRLPGFRSRA